MLTTKYGLKPMTPAEEFMTSSYVRQTRDNKILIIDKCNEIIGLLETIKTRTRNAPELDDEKHAALVEELYEKVLDVGNATVKACKVGY